MHYILRVFKVGGATREVSGGNLQTTAMLRASVLYRDPDVAQIVLMLNGVEVKRGLVDENSCKCTFGQRSDLEIVQKQNQLR